MFNFNNKKIKKGEYFEMKKLKKCLLFAFISLFLSVMAFMSLNCLSVFTYAKIIRPYEPQQAMNLNVSYNNNDILLSVSGGQIGYTYQYWIKKNIETDKNPNSLIKNQFMWQLIETCDTADYTIFDVESNCFDSNGNIKIIVRIKDSSNKLIEELYGIYSSAQIGKPTITNVKFNGKETDENLIVADKNTLVNVTVNANLGGLTYSLYHDETQLGVSNDDGDFSQVNLNNLTAGLQIITVNITDGFNTATKDIKLYIYDYYAPNKRPVITSLTGTSEEDGATTFIMKVKYADGSTIAESDINNFTYKLMSNNKNCSIYGDPIVNNTDETLDITFKINYGISKYGIYYTVGTVSRNDVNSYDDKIIRYYGGYATREAILNQTAESSGYDINTDTYTPNVPITITAEGTINNNTNIEYAFYREDASGWILIRDYQLLSNNPKANELIWTPTKSGKYNIQTRIKDTNAGSYEKTFTKMYTVTGNELTGVFGIKILDIENDEEIENNLVVGKPYKIQAVNNDMNNLLYMFTLSTNNLGTIYLNNYSTNPFSMFIPNKIDSYNITARFVNSYNFGFKDVSASLAVTSFIDYNAVYEDILEENNISNTQSNNIASADALAKGVFICNSGNGNNVIYDNANNRLQFNINAAYEPRAMFIEKKLINYAKNQGYTLLKLTVSHNLNDYDWARIYKLDNVISSIKDVAPYEDSANDYWQSAYTNKDISKTYIVDLTTMPEALTDFYVAYWASNATQTYFTEIKFMTSDAIYEDILEKNNISNTQSNNIANSDALAKGMFICNSGNGNNVIYDNVNNRLQFNINNANEPRAMFIEKNLINYAKNQGYTSLKITISHNLNDYDWARIYKLGNVISSIKDVAPYEESANGYWQSAYTNKEISKTYSIDLTIKPEALTDFYVAYWACNATQTYFTDIHFEK